MDATPILGIPFAEGTDPADAPALSEAMASAIEALLLEIPASQITGGAEANLLVVQSTGAAAFKAMSGDITIDKTGKASIGLLKVVTGMLAELAVTSSKIDDSAVITQKIANLAVTAAKLAADSVEEAKIKDKAVGTAKLADLGTTTEKIANLAVTAAKIAEATITAAKIANNAVTAEKIIAGAITETKLADGAVTSRKLKPTVGQVDATADVNIRETAAVITGTEKELEVPVASKLLITAAFDFQVVDTHAPYDIAYCWGMIQVDGVSGSQRARYVLDIGPDVTQGRATVALTEVRAIAAGKHTVRLRAEGNASSLSVDDMKCMEEGTEYTYMVVSS